MQQFDLMESVRRKQFGMMLAEQKTPLDAARDLARAIAQQRGWVTADDIGRRMPDLGPAAGSLFRGREWVWTGEWKPSSRVTNHGRMLRVWRLA